MRGYVDTRWGQVHYEEQGSGDTTVVLLHETPLNHWAFERLQPILAESYRVIAFDSPGYGESDPPPASTTIEEYSETFREAIDALGLDRVVLFGVHTGASYVVELAHILGDRAQAAVIIGVPFYEESVRQAKVVAVVPEFADDGSHLLTSFNRPPKEYDNQLLSRMVGAVCELPDRAFWAYEAVYKYRPERVLPLLTQPVLFLSNELDPLYTSDNNALPLVKDGEQKIIPSEALPLYWTQAPAVAAEMARFLSARLGVSA